MPQNCPNSAAAASLSAQNYLTFRDKTSAELFRDGRMMLGGEGAIVTPQLWLTIRMTPTGTGFAAPADDAGPRVEENDRDRLGVDLILKDMLVGRAIFDKPPPAVRRRVRAVEEHLVRTTFLDRRRVDGLFLPQRITTEANGRRIDDFIVTALSSIRS